MYIVAGMFIFSFSEYLGFIYCVLGIVVGFGVIVVSRMDIVFGFMGLVFRWGIWIMNRIRACGMCCEE